MLVIILKKLNLSYFSIRWKIVLSYILIIFTVVMVLSSFILGTLYSYLFDQKKMELLTSSNMIASVLTESFNEEFINQKLPQMSLLKESRTIVVNAESHVVYDSYEETNIKGKYFINTSITNALLGTGQDNSNYYKENGSYFVEAAVPVVKNSRAIGAVFMIVSGDSTQQLVGRIRNSMLILGVLIMLFVGVFSTSMAGILTYPVEKLTAFINNMPKDSLQKAEVASKDEIGQLALAFNNLIERLAELEDKRRAFVSDASHELKTPLSIIKLLSDSLIQTEHPDPEFIKEFLSDMNKEVERLTRIIERLLNLTQMDSRQLNMNLEEIDMRELAGEIHRKLEPLAKNKSIDFKLSVPEEPVMLSIERDSLTEAIYNIADNSIKYTEDFGSVTLELTHDLGNVFIVISDNGIGIPKEETAKIFDRFYRVDKARARETGGTGLGLSIALDAVKLHGGHIEVMSEENEGSKFTIILPYKD